MNYCERKESEILTVDIHNFDRDKAKYYLENLLRHGCDNYSEIVVIHGWRRGQELMNMVRSELKHPKISKKYLSLNPGITSLILNSSK